LLKRLISLGGKEPEGDGRNEGVKGSQRWGGRRRALAFCLFGEQFQLTICQSEEKCEGVSGTQSGSQVQSGNSEWECGNLVRYFWNFVKTWDLGLWTLGIDRVRTWEDRYGTVIALLNLSLAHLGGGTWANQR
jgi:hypothetical protein